MKINQSSRISNFQPYVKRLNAYMDMQKTLKHDILSKYKHFKNLKLLKVTFLSFSLDQYTNGMILY